MNAEQSWLAAAEAGGLLIDTNLLVLFTVGSVNPARIQQFKRTSKYTKAHYDVLLQMLARSKRVYTVAHVLAEVSNLTDLSGPERQRARDILKQTISLLNEVEMPSTRAAEDRVYRRHGLVDAAIAAVARERNCAVLTDDFNLYSSLSHDNVNVFNFTYLYEQV